MSEPLLFNLPHVNTSITLKVPLVVFHFVPLAIPYPGQSHISHAQHFVHGGEYVFLYIQPLSHSTVPLRLTHVVGDVSGSLHPIFFIHL